MKNKTENIIKGILYLLLSQIFIKIIGLAYKFYLTNKEGFGDVGNAIYSSGFQIYALLLTFSSTGVPNAISKMVSERLAVRRWKRCTYSFQNCIFLFCIYWNNWFMYSFFRCKIYCKKFNSDSRSRV